MASIFLPFFFFLLSIFVDSYYEFNRFKKKKIGFHPLISFVWIVTLEDQLDGDSLQFLIFRRRDPCSSVGAQKLIESPQNPTPFTKRSRLSRCAHSYTRCRRHNGSIEALPLLARFGETIERANGFVAACSLFANRPCIRNYWSKGVVKPRRQKYPVSLLDTVIFLLVEKENFIDKFLGWDRYEIDRSIIIFQNIPISIRRGNRCFVFTMLEK